MNKRKHARGLANGSFLACGLSLQPALTYDHPGTETVRAWRRRARRAAAKCMVDRMDSDTAVNHPPVLKLAP